MESIVRPGSLGDILFRCQIISENDIRAALDEQQTTGCRFGEALVKLGVVAQEDIDWALSNQLNIPYVRLKPTMVDTEAVALIPAALARQHNLIPLIVTGDEISIAIADPLNTAALAAVEKAAGCPVSVSVGLLREIREMQEIFYGPPEETDILGFESAAFPASVLSAINHDLTGAKFVDYLLLFVVQQKLSSLSLQPLGDGIVVVCRRGGVGREAGRLSPTHYPEVVMRVKKLAKLAGGEFTAKGAFAFGWKGRMIPFQVALLRGEGGDYLTFRMRVDAAFPDSVADMGLPEATTARFAELAAAGRGMVVVGAREEEMRGRLMELYLQECDTAGKTVIMVGSGPPQGGRRFPRVPVPAGTEVGAVVMAALEHDPDILILEDVADGKVFAAACRAAQRGTLVVAGLSCGDGAGALQQLITFRDRHLLTPAHLRGIIVCAGVRTLCPDCRAAVPSPPDETEPSFRSAGCPACGQTGYAGTRFLMDIIAFDQRVRELFETARDSGDVLGHLREHGWRGIAEDGRALVAQGVISREDFTASLLG
ncbi:GspE/PulE family protein [Geobacter grbiciae]|uniref:GspE/PulE family protein n=1 Tax=Geobacter grbiciae TaxID=155042 RepID=UPI001C038474|nr:ATPase, T2SS/T4P/T4SS family [Geobacter grbiciae]MBT1074077.1 pilus assembly protein PilB [Geobacter grbiciae]